jgi:hypothetical protein
MEKMKNRVLFTFVGILVLVVGLIALGVCVYNLGAASVADESAELPLRLREFGPFPSVLGIVFVAIGFMILLKIAVPMILFPLFGIGFWGARRRWRRCGPWPVHPMDWEDGVPPMVRSWHRRMHEMDEGDESPVEE